MTHFLSVYTQGHGSKIWTCLYFHGPFVAAVHARSSPAILHGLADSTIHAITYTTCLQLPVQLPAPNQCLHSAQLGRTSSSPFMHERMGPFMRNPMDQHIRTRATAQPSTSTPDHISTPTARNYFQARTQRMRDPRMHSTSVDLHAATPPCYAQGGQSCECCAPATPHMNTRLGRAAVASRWCVPLARLTALPSFSHLETDLLNKRQRRGSSCNHATGNCTAASTPPPMNSPPPPVCCKHSACWRVVRFDWGVSQSHSATTHSTCPVLHC